MPNNGVLSNLTLNSNLLIFASSGPLEYGVMCFANSVLIFLTKMLQPFQGIPPSFLCPEDGGSRISGNIAEVYDLDSHNRRNLKGTQYVVLVLDYRRSSQFSAAQDLESTFDLGEL